ncbi:MAG: recombination protein RecR [Lentisphaerae bacterium]|nr:recombination protein RecR [Lentisphaerota bacterium]
MDALDRLTAALSRLPGVGRRSAERMAARIARGADGYVGELVAALRAVEANVRPCSRCGSLTDKDREPCALCADPGRDAGILCVVEDPGDIVAIERSGGYRGRYHALMGRISPMRAQGPDDLRIEALLKRVQEEKIAEVVLALNTDVESDATAAYVGELLRKRGVKTTRIAYGLPAGSAVMYSDAVTLARAMRGRQEA